MSANQTPTPHIGAHYDEIARTVIMAGDPLRAQYMADNYLENPVVVNRIRGMLGFTGTYRGKKVSVMGHGMGIPSISIYTYELFNFYDVDTIIRIGSAGSYHPDLHIGDLVFAQGASTDSNYGAQFGLPGTFAPIADFGLLRKAVEAGETFGYRFKVGNVLSSDTFYSVNPQNEKWASMGVLAVEMEASALYMNAAWAKKRALAILTVSDHLVTGEACTPEERRTTFTHMMDVALALI